MPSKRKKLVLSITKDITIYLLCFTVGFLVYKFFGKIRFESDTEIIYGDYTPYYNKENSQKLILYTSNSCQACTESKILLEKNSIDYVERVIESNQKYKDHLFELGINSVPVLMYKTKIIIGFSRDIITLTNED